MLVLGIESTAHTYGIALLRATTREKRILSNLRASFTTKSGGMVPVKVADHHEAVCDQLFQQALAAAKVPVRKIDLIAVSNAPGLGHALKVGLLFARTLAMRHQKPIVGVNHCIAHLEVAGLVTRARDPVLLYCSGANTQVIAYDGGKYRVFGETLDVGVGNFLDSLARLLGLGFPGGPLVERLAKKGGVLLKLPYSVKGMDVAFSGILTFIKRRLLRKEKKEEIAFSAQETVFAMLVEVAERALAHCEKRELVLGGGVACNQRLQEMARLMCTDRGARCFIPPPELLVDNAAMIAWTGYLMHARGGITDDPRRLRAKPYERTDEVSVTWR